MKRNLKIIFFGLIIVGLICGSNKLKFNFDSTTPGNLPEGFVAGQTANRGILSVWKAIKDETAPSPENVLMVVPNPRTNHGACFNVLIYENASFKNLQISVWIKPVGGREDQGGGPIWRAKDKNNYYVVRWNPLENNFRLYYVKNGRRHMIRSARLYADSSKWHEIKVIQRDNDIKCYFDGKLKLHTTNSTFTEAGKIGLWSKADANTKFDNLETEEVK